MHVVIIGGGFAGMASAARLAKMGHAVTLFDAAPTLGGALSQVHLDDFTFDGGPSATLLPAVTRDLFRKSGRPLEREYDLVPVPVIVEHRFVDGTSLALTGGSRAGQKVAFDALGDGLGHEWVGYVDTWGETWERLRKDYLERPWDPAMASPESKRILASRLSLAQRLRSAFTDDRLALVAGHRFTSEGHDLRRVPAWLGALSYVEQKFGAWTSPQGLGGLSAVMASRLRTRKVDVHTSTAVLDVLVRGGRAVGVRTAAGEVAADAVVCAVDPRRLPALRSLVRRTRSTSLPHLTHLGLVADGAGDPPGELVLHGTSPLVLRHGGSAPEGKQVVTVQSREIVPADLLDVMAARGHDLRDRVVARLDRTPGTLTREWGGSPLGVQWRGAGTVRNRLGPDTPVKGLYAAGAHATPGSGLPFTGLSGALVAQAIGPA